MYRYVGRPGYLLFIGLLTLLPGCDIPRDSGSTWDHIQTHEVIQAGLVMRSEDDTLLVSTFKEKEKLEALASALEVKINFKKGASDELIHQLRHHELDIVGGSFKKSSLYKKEVGFTSPYDNRHVFAIPKGENGWLYQLDKTIRKLK